MSKAAGLYAKTTTKSPKPAASSAPKLHVGRELLDTTWRMAVPVVLFAGLGIVADRAIESSPWLTLAGMVIGFALAGVLIKRQLDRWPADLKLKPGAYKNYYKDEDKNEDENKDYYDD